MPTNRTRIKRAARSRVTEEARAIYKDALKLQDIYWDCISNDVCRSTTVGKHCPECANYKDLSLELGRLIGLKPWETSPLNADSEAPPDYLRHNPLQLEYWHKARALRGELENE